MQVDPITPKLKPPGNKPLKLLKCDVLLSPSAFKFNLRRYSKAAERWKSKETTQIFRLVGRCMVKPVLASVE